jgi:hypothetical protein
MGRIILSTDCLVLKQAMETSSHDLSRLGPMLLHDKFLLRTSFLSYSIEYVPRSCNKPAHVLAALGARGVSEFNELWFGELPPDVSVLVANDLVVH